LAADTDFSDFLIPMGENGQDFDFGTAAMKMLEGIRRTDDDGDVVPKHEPIEEVEEPPSPSPGVPKGFEDMMVLTDAPRSRRSADIRRSVNIKREEGLVERQGSTQEPADLGDELEFVKQEEG
jgi:hypothetical protein